MVARVEEPLDSDHLARFERPPPGHAGDQRKPSGQLSQDIARLSGHGGVLRIRHDRRERPVDVEEERRGRWIGPDRVEEPRQVRCGPGRLAHSPPLATVIGL